MRMAKTAKIAEAEVGERPVGGREVRTGDATPDTELGERVQGEHESLHEQAERQRHQRDVQVAEADREEADDHADARRRPAPPTTMASRSTGQPWSVATAPAPRAPTPANVIWQSQSMPPSPVTSVNDEEHDGERSRRHRAARARTA